MLSAMISWGITSIPLSSQPELTSVSTNCLMNFP